MNALSIKWKMLIPAQLALVAFVAVITFFWSNVLATNLQSGFMAKIDLGLQAASATAASAVWDFDAELGAAALEGLASVDGFVFAQILSDGEKFAQYTPLEAWFEGWYETIASAMSVDLASLSEPSESLVPGPLYITRVELTLNDRVVGSIVAAFDDVEIRKIIKENNLRAINIAAVAFFVFAIILYSLVTTITRPVGAIIEKLKALQEGDTAIELTQAKRGDEIGLLGKAVLTVRDSMLERERLEREQQQAEARQIEERERRLKDERDHERALEKAAREKADSEKRRMEEEAKANEERRREQERTAAEQAYVVSTLGTSLELLSQGDLCVEIESAFPPAYEKLREDYNQALKSLRAALTSVSRRTDGLRSGASEISEAATDLAHRTERQAATLAETAMSISELTSSIHSAAQLAEETKDESTRAQEKAESGEAIAKSAVQAMDAIKNSSEQISKITSVIEDIAFQTNLLALNAGVEAARAGDAGRGFAVVATEVRELSQRSSNAAQEIKDHISESATHVQDGVDLVGRTGSAFVQIVESVTEITGKTIDFSETSKNQSKSIQKVHDAVTQLDAVTQRNAAMFEETTAATHIVTGEANSLSRDVSKFRISSEDDTFEACSETSSEATNAA